MAVGLLHGDFECDLGLLAVRDVGQVQSGRTRGRRARRRDRHVQLKSSLFSFLVGRGPPP